MVALQVGWYSAGGGASRYPFQTSSANGQPPYSLMRCLAFIYADSLPPPSSSPQRQVWGWLAAALDAWTGKGQPGAWQTNPGCECELGARRGQAAGERKLCTAFLPTWCCSCSRNTVPTPLCWLPGRGGYATWSPARDQVCVCLGEGGKIRKRGELIKAIKGSMSWPATQPEGSRNTCTPPFSSES